jgi:hypothetical protein
MKKSNIFITILAFFMLMSCNGPVRNESGQSSNLPVQEQDQQQEDAKMDEVPPVIPQEPNQLVAEQSEPQVMLNPPHGQPYHRCDIPVGSPLPANSPEQASTNPVVASAPVTAPAPAATPATASATVDNSMIPTLENANRLNTSPGRQTTTASGTPPVNNPPHGQPWHRCDIPVGSPLPR